MMRCRLSIPDKVYSRPVPAPPPSKPALSNLLSPRAAASLRTSRQFFRPRRPSGTAVTACHDRAADNLLIAFFQIAGHFGLFEQRFDTLRLFERFVEREMDARRVAQLDALREQVADF